MKTTDEPMQAVAKMHPHTRKVATVLAEKRQTPVQEQLEFADELCMLRADYDEEADVLYLYLNEPAAAISEAGEDGILLRYRIDDEKPCGVTILSYHSDWGDLQDQLADRVSDFLHVGREAARQLLGHIR